MAAVHLHEFKLLFQVKLEVAACWDEVQIQAHKLCNVFQTAEKQAFTRFTCDTEHALG